MYSEGKPLDSERIRISKKMLSNLFDNIYTGNVSELAADKGLPYSLAYNLVNGRVRSLSVKDYKKIFGEAPPYRQLKRVDGTLFRDMVKLWLFLNDDMTEADLYREFYPNKKIQKVDYRVFCGVVKTVETRLEKIMEKKFLDQGLTRLEIGEWIKELYTILDKERVLYEDIKPDLDYLEKHLKVNPTRLLHQSAIRYESGELKTVPKRVYDRVLNVIKMTEEALNSGSKFEIEKIREGIYGKRDGLTLYSEVEDELQFLRKYGGKSPRRYLGRSISYYKRSQLKRIASWRAQKIKAHCNELIRKRSDIHLLSLPKSYLRTELNKFLSIIKTISIRKLMEDKSGSYEKTILTPLYYSREEYRMDKYGFTAMDKAPSVLGMSKKAFDLMVAEHSDIFRKIGRYERKKWYLPDLYLKEISEKAGFDLIKSKYELMAKGDNDSLQSIGGEGKRDQASNKKASRRMVVQSYPDSRGFENHVKIRGVSRFGELLVS